jgi:hypothetical protein
LKLIFKITFALAGLLLLTPFIFDMVTVDKLSWEQVQRYGGIRIERPLESEDGYHMPLICDVSGAESISVPSVAFSSYNVYKRAKVKIDGHMIYISISITGPFFKDDTPACKAVKLGKLEHGHYLVYYEGGELIGDFYI